MVRFIKSLFIDGNRLIDPLDKRGPRRPDSFPGKSASLENGGLGTQLPNLVRTARHAAAPMRHKWNHRLAGKDVTCQERRDRRRNRARPVGAADENHIILAHILYFGGQFRPNPFLNLLPGLHGAFPVFGGIRLDRLDFKQRSSRRPLNLRSGVLRIASP